MPLTKLQTAGELAAHLGAELVGFAGAAISGVESLDRARNGQLTFIRSPKFAAQFAESHASVALVTRGVIVPPFDVASRALIVVDDADRAMLAVLRLLDVRTEPLAGIHPSAIVASDATIDPTAHIGPHVSIGARCVIGARAAIHAGARLGSAVRIGAGTTISANVCIMDRCVIGSGCIVHSNCVIGADGFGYLPGPRGLEKIPHIGNVEIGDDVEIGAGSCVDRGKFGATIIGNGTKIDNLVQIAHNCHIGNHVVICGCSGIAGSVNIGDGSIIGGKVGISDGITLGKGCRIAAHSGVMHDVPEGETFAGIPSVRQRDWARAHIALKRLAESGSQGGSPASDRSAGTQRRGST